MKTELRLGDWRDHIDALGEVDAMITDPPYGSRTHEGDIAAAVQQQSATGQAVRRAIDYGAFTAEDAAHLISAMAPRVKGWMAVMTSHDLIPAYEQAMTEVGRYVFAPLAYVRKIPRLLGDGPASWMDYIVVSRPRSIDYSRWRCLPGAYIEERGMKERKPIVGGKPLWLMRALVRDYTNEGDTVIDPFAGGATTLLAARELGRHSIGFEIDEAHYNIARDRIDAPAQADLWH